MRAGWIGAGLLMLAACAPPAQPAGCGFPGTSPMLVAQLFFGRGNVSDAAWAAFAADTLTTHFPDGFTALDGAGQWREAPGRPIGREASKLVVIGAPDTPTTLGNLRAVIAVYRNRFQQKSVGLVLDRACASF